VDSLAPDCDLPSTLLFCDNKDLVMDIQYYLNSRLSPAHSHAGLISAYHGDYSDNYHWNAWALYREGSCKVLVATSSAGTVSILNAHPCVTILILQ
jgi:hypothetical protein